MKYHLTKNLREKGKEVEYARFDVTFTVIPHQELSQKDKKKIYKIIRIIHSLGDDDIDEMEDTLYRNMCDEDSSWENLLDAVKYKKDEKIS